MSYMTSMTSYFPYRSNSSSGLVSDTFHGSRDMRTSDTEDLAERPTPIPESVSQETNRKSQLFPVSKNPHTRHLYLSILVKIKGMTKS